MQRAWADEALSLTIPCVDEEPSYIACGRGNCINNSGKVLAGSLKLNIPIQYDVVILLCLMYMCA